MAQNTAKSMLFTDDALKRINFVPFSDATAPTRLDSHTYAVNLQPCFLIGTVPNGGYVASAILRCAQLHLTRGSSSGEPSASSRPSGVSHPDTMTAHFEFIDRTEVGPAV